MSASRVWLSEYPNFNLMMGTHTEVCIVTGASSGLGLEMTRNALANGERVVATLRRPDVLKEFAAQYSSRQLLVVQLDVTKPQEIKDAFVSAKETFGRVDVVFNNAGYIVAGEAEAIPDEPARDMFEVNFWGAAHVSQEAVRFFRDENKPPGGRLLQTSAGVGLFSVPTAAFYGATKHGELSNDFEYVPNKCMDTN